jgi:ABC-2 type transport system ATP-binding protein
VRKAFSGVHAVDGLSFDVQPGRVTVLLGPNGAGKTTALRLATGALLADAGEVRTFGLDPATDGTEVRRRTGVVSAKPALYDRLSGRDNLRYAAELWRLGPDAPIEASAARFGIAGALDSRVGGWSTGMKTRLALARAVLHDPDLLLLDEPTSGLDPESSQAVLRLIREAASSGTAVVLCTHLLLEAEGLADHVVLVDHGQAVVAGPPDQLVRTLWPTPQLLLDATDRAALRAALDRLALPVGAVVEVGRGLQVDLRDADAVPDVVAALVGAGVALTLVQPHAPTLEELYLEVRRRGGWDPAAHDLEEVRR